MILKKSGAFFIILALILMSVFVFAECVDIDGDGIADYCTGDGSSENPSIGDPSSSLPGESSVPDGADRKATSDPTSAEAGLGGLSGDDSSSGDSKSSSEGASCEGDKCDDCGEIEKEEGTSSSSGDKSTSGDTSGDDKTSEEKQSPPKEKLTDSEKELIKNDDGDADQMSCRFNQLLDPKNKATDATKKEILDGFFNPKMTAEKRNQIWGKMNDVARKSFFDAMAKNKDVFGMPIDTKGLKEGGQWVGEKGAMKFIPKGLSENQAVDFGAIKKFVDNNGGAKAEFEYRGNKYTGHDFKFQGVSLGDNQVEYQFQDDSKVVVSKGNGNIVFGEDGKKLGIKLGEKNYDIRMMRGIIEVSDSIKLKMITYADSSVTSGFPVLVDEQGSQKTVFQHKAQGVSAPANIKKPGAGEYSAWTNNGNVYTVDNKGVVRVISDAVINSDGSVQSMFVYNKDFGETFSTRDKGMYVNYGSKPPATYDPKSGNALWAWSEGGKVNVKMVTQDGTGDYGYYNQLANQNLGTVDLRGDAMFRSGSVLFSSDRLDGFSDGGNGLYYRKLSVDGYEILKDLPAGNVDKISVDGKKSGFKINSDANNPSLVSIGKDGKESQVQMKFEGAVSEQKPPQPGGETGQTDDGTKGIDAGKTDSGTTSSGTIGTSRDSSQLQTDSVGKYGSLDFKYTKSEVIKKELSEGEEKWVAISEPSHCPPCRKAQDSRVDYITNTQASNELGIGTFPTPYAVKIKKVGNGFQVLDQKLLGNYLAQLN